VVKNFNNVHPLIYDATSIHFDKRRCHSLHGLERASSEFKNSLAIGSRPLSKNEQSVVVLAFIFNLNLTLLNLLKDQFLFCISASPRNIKALKTINQS
jgi:hypothetical protein